ncbi:MAG: tetratricopeptide repeat protein [archaeon]|nr:tetratricopeptide repeat protein [archaeon]
METENDFLEISVVPEISQKIEQIETNCEGETGENVVEERIKQLAYAKILCTVYNKDNFILIKAYTELGIAYLDINYCQQARDHLLTALSLNETKSETNTESNLKEFQIKILINLSKAYLLPDKSLKTPETDKEKKQFEEDSLTKTKTALQIADKCLKMNQKINGVDHISNVDIFYIMAKANTSMEDYEEALKNYENIFALYNNIYGPKSQQIAKVYMEMAQIYNLENLLNDSVANYKNAYAIFEEIIADDNYEELFDLALKISDLYSRMGGDSNYEEAYKILCDTEDKYGSNFERTDEAKVTFQKKRINTCSKLKNKDKMIEENKSLEVN